MKASSDRAGMGLHFNIPTVVNGRVYVGVKGAIGVYGLLSPPGPTGGQRQGAAFIQD